MLKKYRAVIPGRAEGASPESRNAGNPDVLDSGPAASRRPGMTAAAFFNDLTDRETRGGRMGG
jgi:hypothetical protein